MLTTKIKCKMFASYKNVFTPNVFPRSIRFSQNLKRITYFERRWLYEKRILDALTSVLSNRKSLTVDEWK